MDLLLETHLKVWASRALADARRQQLDLARRLPPSSVARRLRRDAGRLTRSPSGYEQLLRRALAAAGHGERARAALELRRLLRTPDPLAQLSLRMQVLAAARENTVELVGQAVRREERRGARRTAGAPDDAAQWLTAAAALNRVLWDHPGLAVEPAVRAAMLACATRLESRAIELSRSGAGPLFPNPRHGNPSTKETRDGAQPARS